MKAFRVGDIIAPHYHLHIFSEQRTADVVLPTDVIVVVGVEVHVGGAKRGFVQVGEWPVPNDDVEERVWNVTLLLHGGHVRNYAVLDPSPWEVTTAQ